jgi:predicted metal-binding membrane protein
MAATSPLLSGWLLLAAGAFQWTPLKRAFLKGCRSPLSFLMSEWREGTGGAFVMGTVPAQFKLPWTNLGNWKEDWTKDYAGLKLWR